MWTTARIYTQRKARRQWKPVAAVLAALAVLTGGSLAYTGLNGAPATEPATRTQADTPVVSQPQATDADIHRTVGAAPSGQARNAQRPAGVDPLGDAPAAATTAKPPAVLSAAARKALISKLGANRRLVLTPLSRSQLIRVDARVLRALDALLPAHTVRVISFSGTKGKLLTTATMDRVDGKPILVRDLRTVDAVRLFRTLTGTLRPASALVVTKGTTSTIVLTYR